MKRISADLLGQAIAICLLAGLLAFALAGCGTLGGMIAPMEPIAMPENLSDAGKEAQKLISEADVALGVAYDLVKEKRQARLITKAEALRHLNDLDDYSAKVDEAHEAMGKQDYLLAKTKAEAVKLLIEAIRNKVAQKARQS